MDFAPFVVLVLLNKKIVDWFRELLPDRLESQWIQLVAFAVGVVTAFLFAESTFGNGIDVWDGITLDQLNVLGVVIYGLSIGAGGGVLTDAIRRRNPSDEAPVIEAPNVTVTNVLPEPPAPAERVATAAKRQRRS